MNAEIDQALNDYASKNGGVGGNRPDAKLLLCDINLVAYPVLIYFERTEIGKPDSVFYFRPQRKIGCPDCSESQFLRTVFSKS